MIGATWNDAGVDVKVELSTSGDLIAAVMTDLPFVDLNADQMADGWAWQSASGTPMGHGYASNVSGGIWKYKFAYATSSTIYAHRLVSGIVGTHTYRVSVRVQRYDTTLPASQAQLVVFQYKDNVNNNVTGVLSGSVTVTDQWQELSVNMFGMKPDTNQFLFRLIFNGGNNHPGQDGGGAWTEFVYTDTEPSSDPMTWRDITCDVKSIAIRHGRERYTERYDTGSLVVNVVNADGEYRYADPHPFGLRPGRVLRVTAKYLPTGSDYPLAYCIIDSIQDAYDIEGRQIVTLTAYDVTTLAANRTTPYIRGNAGTPISYFATSGARITALLDALGYLNRSISTGVFQQQEIESSGRSIRDEMGISSDSEGGYLFAERGGTIVYRDRNWETTSWQQYTVTANFLARQDDDAWAPTDNVPTMEDAPIICPRTLGTEWNQSRVVNEVSLANAGGTAREYDNRDSQKKYGVKSYQRHDFVNRNASDLDIRANDYLAGYGDAVLRLNTLQYNPMVADDPAAVWAWTLSVFLNWVIRVNYRHPLHGWGWTMVTRVQSVEHTITVSGWTTNLTLDHPLAYMDETEIPGWDMALWDIGLWDEVANDPTYWDSGELWEDATTTWGE